MSVRRCLTAIHAGYGRMMGADEEGTFARLNLHRRTLGGRLHPTG